MLKVKVSGILHGAKPLDDLLLPAVSIHISPVERNLIESKFSAWMSNMNTTAILNVYRDDIRRHSYARTAVVYGN